MGLFKDKMDIYLVVIQDRHAETEVKAFFDRSEAIKFARDCAIELASREQDYKELEIDGWEFFAKYSPDGDHIRVLKREIH